MEKLTFAQWKDQQFVDLRPQKEYQSGHLQGALNLIPKNLVKFGEQLLDGEKEIVLVGSKEEVAAVDATENIAGYLDPEDLPAAELVTTPTIPTADFMALEGEYILLDVRHPDEITRPAPEKNLVNIPMEDLPAHHADFRTGQQIYTLCGSGNRATAAASYLESQGYKPIVIEGGMGAIEEFQQKN